MPTPDSRLQNSDSFTRLRKLLAELFQLDQAELDFGIYRIMNAKREEIVRFLDQDLLPQVREAFQAYEAENRGAVEAELAEAIGKAKELGADPETLPRVKELRAKLAQAVDVTALENEVYSHLYNFFRRYYQEGDFISLRRYKEGVYAIPYEGEEVKLHWANHDQYYIKTSEYLRNYAFKLPSGKRVHFKLAQANTEKDNNRPANGNERRFILSQEQPLAEEKGELVVRFDYRPHPDKAKQMDLNTAAVDRILNQTRGFDDWRRELAALRPTEKNPNRTLLEKHLADYTARNTFDYFIHKDLGGFLRRELDFYIKNEVMHLDDIESETAPRVEQYLSKIKAIRRIAHKIIDFLAQIENFQKKLWLKKKFVVETQYCITLDRIFAIEDEKTREWLVELILKNDAQREEWVRLCAIDQESGVGSQESGERRQANLFAGGQSSKYSVPLTKAFLEARPTLVVDTRHFDEAFKLRLLAAIPDIDEETDGLLIHSENFQALNLLQVRYREQVKCVYIDPPYNTGADEFIYLDRYQHASWLTMLDNRLRAGASLMGASCGLFVNIDDGEAHYLKLLCDEVFGRDNFVRNIVWQKRTSPDMRATVGDGHDHIVLYARSLAEFSKSAKRLPKTFEQRQAFRNPDGDPRGPWVSSDFTAQGHRPNQMYKIVTPGGAEYYPPEGRCWKNVESVYLQLVREGRMWFGHDGKGIPRRKTYLSESEDNAVWSWWTNKEVGHTQEARKELIAVFGDATVFSTPKPERLLHRIVHIASEHESIVLDYFAGSGTTGHAVINLNREDGGRRKFILVEMGEYFDTVLVPRIKKVIFTPEWKDGKPNRMPTKEEIDRSPRIVKILRLESYEDTLNNLELKRTEPQQTLLEEHAAFREDYMLHYMLNVESRGSASLLNLERFEDPFSYKLDIATGTAGETKPTVVDLVETFNYLIGLRVKTMDDVRGVRVVTGVVGSQESGDGRQKEEKVLVLWRRLPAGGKGIQDSGERSQGPHTPDSRLPTPAIDNDTLDAWFRKQGYNTKDQEFDVIYVNGDNNLENLRKADQTWKVRLIEEEFRRLMFDVQDV